ncbi:MAG: peptide transporter [Gammaproteobacteria bacterium]|nr:MAG: peptide transporter [Gammaproteobacteria bacterium]
MLDSFFPRPKLFFASAFAWFLVTLTIWYGGANELTQSFGLMKEIIEVPEGKRPAFLTPDKVWLYQYLVLVSILFCVFWFFIARSRWYWWSVVGSAFILVVTYFQVQISVWLNNWYGDFYDLIQVALTEPESITLGQYYGELKTAAYILVPYIMVLAFFSFFTSHYVFRWRTAMNDYYMSQWQHLRHIEGASQRIQEDTMRFAFILEQLGSRLISSVMTLIAFLPLLYTLSQQVTELPIVGAVDGSLVFLALLSAAFGTVLLAVVGVRLPGLEFNNQKVEAAYRKELVYGEDHADRADIPEIRTLYGGVRRNYFRLYFHYLYFDLFRWAYIQGANFIPFIALGPTFVAAGVTFGAFQQIMNAFTQVESSFQYLVHSWKSIIELMSIQKRLKGFESNIDKSRIANHAEPGLAL